MFIRTLSNKTFYSKPITGTISDEKIIALRPQKIFSIDCLTVTIQDLQRLKTDFEFASIVSAPLSGLAGWFEVTFPGGIKLRTGPQEPVATHWMQALFYFEDNTQLAQDDKVSGSIEILGNVPEKRTITVNITMSVPCGKQLTKSFVF